jgi:Zn-dependent peptidase ImmA (M78 family)
MRWLALKVGGQRIGVYVVRRKHKMLDGADGVYHPELARIYLASDLEEGPREDTLIHELDHVVNEVSGVNNVLRDACGASKIDAVEEQIVRCRTPIWHRLLCDLGFRFPRGLYQ